jgi:hypothetical protein
LSSRRAPAAQGGRDDRQRNVAPVWGSLHSATLYRAS